MSDNSKIALGVAGGYLLGRTKKMKLALSLGGLLIGQKIPTNPRELLKQGQKLVQGNENLSEIDEMFRGKLLEAARAAALATLSSRMNSVSDSIRERTDGLRELANELEEAADDVEEDESDEEQEDEQEGRVGRRAGGRAGARGRVRGRRRAGRGRWRRGSRGRSRPGRA